MDKDDKDASEASDGSLSGPEEISNKDAKEVAVSSIKAEIASQRSLKEKAKKLKLQIENRNIEQKKVKEEKKAKEAKGEKADDVDDSSPPKPAKSETDDVDDSSPHESAKSEIDDKAVSLGVEKIQSEKSGKNIKPKKKKKRKNKNFKRDSSTGNNQADSKIDSNIKAEPKRLNNAAKKKIRFIQYLKTGKPRTFKKKKAEANKPKTNVVSDNKSTEKAHGEKRKFKETKNDNPKIKSIKIGKVGNKKIKP